jgi:hypothetical protein
LRMAVAQDPELVVAVGRASFVLSLHWSAAQVQWVAPDQHNLERMYDIAVVPEAGLFVTVGAGGSVRQGTVVPDRIEWTK